MHSKVSEVLRRLQRAGGHSNSMRLKSVFLALGKLLILSLELLSCNPFILIADSWRNHILMITLVISSKGFGLHNCQQCLVVWMFLSADNT